MSKQSFPQLRIVCASVAAALAVGVVVNTPVFARTTKIEITERGIAFGGYSFPGVGQYERIVGIASGELDPKDAQNAVITDIALAPVNKKKKVEYRHNFYILKPVDLSKGNHKMMYEPPNRGGKTHNTLNRTPQGNANDPGATTNAAVLGNAFLWSRGYTTAWSGWEDLADLANNPTYVSSVELAIAHNRDGSTITGPAYEYIVMGAPAAGNPVPTTYTLTYAAASPNKADVRFTHRVHLNDLPLAVPDADWSYDAAGKVITLSTGFSANDIYEFSYKAKDPKVAGIGFAAVRDFNSFLRNAKKDDFGTPNPLAGDVTRIYTEISSQPGRMLNDFRHLGFNQDEDGKKVFDGLMQWVAAADGINMNYRWSQSGRTERNRQDLLYAEGVFPFANQVTIDPYTFRIDGRYLRCTLTNTCPLAVEFYSSNEYWVKAASLFHTDPLGFFDLPDIPQARLYLLSSKQHGGAGNPGTPAKPSTSCQQKLNPLDSQEVQRALFVALDEWSTHGTPPPASRVPHLHDHTMVPPLPQSRVGFPNIPGVKYTGLQSTRYLFNYGPTYYTNGIPTINPPVVTAPYQDNPVNGRIYPTYVPTTDTDGNEIAGIRLPEVQAPIATYMGWNLRPGVWADDGCEGSGSFVPFAKTQGDRTLSGDPRPSVQERWPTYVSYQTAVLNAIDNLVKDRLVLCEDAAAMRNRAIGLATTWGGLPGPVAGDDVNKLPASCS